MQEPLPIDDPEKLVAGRHPIDRAQPEQFVMHEMAGAAEEQAAQQDAVPPLQDLPVPEPSVGLANMDVPEVSAPDTPQIDVPQTDMLAEMGKVAEAKVPAPPKQTAFQQRHGVPVPPQPLGQPDQVLGEMGKTAEAQVPEQPKQTAWQKRHQGPFRYQPASVQTDVMRDMGAAVQSASEPTVGGIAGPEMERMTAPGDQEAALKRRFADHMEGMKRFQDSLVESIRQLTEVVVSHEVELRALRGYLERNRL